MEDYPSVSGRTSAQASVQRRSLLKVALGAGAALAGGSLLAGCASGNPAVVRLWTWFDEQRDEFPKLINAFQEKHPNIKVVNRPFGTLDQYLPVLQAAVADGDVPDIFAPDTRALVYGTGDLSADLTTELGNSFFADFFDSVNQEYTIDGEQYAVGWMAQAFGIFYNPDLMSIVGVDVAATQTWDDLIAAAQKFKTAGIDEVALSCSPVTSSLDFFLPLLTQVSGDPTFFLNLDQQRGVTWEDPVVVKALELTKRLVDAGVFRQGATRTSGSQAEQSFYTQKSAMLFDGCWLPQKLLRIAPTEFVKKYKVMKTPAISDGKRHWTANQAQAGLAVSKYSKSKDAALTFLEFIYDPPRYLMTMNESDSMPCTKEAAAQVKNPLIKEMASWLLLGDGCPHIPFGKGTVAAGDPLAHIFEGNGDPEEVAHQMQAAVINAGG